MVKPLLPILSLLAATCACAISLSSPSPLTPQWRLPLVLEIIGESGPQGPVLWSNVLNKFHWNLEHYVGKITWNFMWQGVLKWLFF